MFKASVTAALTALALLMLPASASASVVIIQSCSTTDLTPEADDCVGEITNPNNDFQNVDYDDPDSDKDLAVNELYYSLDADPTVHEGLFDYTDWVALARDDDASVGDNPAAYQFDTDLNMNDGDWSVLAGSLDGFDDVMIVLKAGNGWVAYYYDDVNGLNGGTFDLTWTNNALSHATLYARGFSDLPEPAVLGLLGLGLIGVGAARRRRKMG